MAANIEQIKAMLERTGKTNLLQKQKVDLDKERLQLEATVNREKIDKSPEVDLEKEFSQEYATYHLPDFILGTLCDGTGVIDFIYKTARHFWNKGYNARKEE